MRWQNCEENTQVTAVELTVLAGHVQRCLGSQVRHLCVIACDQGIILQGRAHTYYAKQLAQHAVMRATRLPILANEIEVS
jgi:hypothetical protein